MTIFDRFKSDLLHLFDKRLIDIVFYGSIIKGDFDEEKSDIDFIVFIKNILSHHDIESIIKLHKNYRTVSSISRLLEGRYIGIDNKKMINGYYIGTKQKGWKEISTLGFDSIEMGMILDCYTSLLKTKVVEEHLICDWERIKQDILIQLKELKNHNLFGVNKVYTDYALVTSARTVYTHINKGFLTKKEAVIWIQDNGVNFDLNYPVKTIKEIDQFFHKNKFLINGFSLIDINNVELDNLITMIIKCNNGTNKVRYFPTSIKGVKSRINDLIKRNNRDIKVVLENGKIIGFVDINVEQTESYIQIDSIFTEQHKKIVLDVIFNYIKTKYKGYRLHYVLSDFNIEYIDYMNSINAVNDGLETMLLINKVKFFNGNFIGVSNLPESKFDEFKFLHDSIYPNAYWNSDLILDRDKFDIYISGSESITGFSVVSRMGRNEEEIYFLFSESDEERIRLVNHSLLQTFSRAESVILLLQHDELKHLELYRSTGFKIKERIITFEISKV